MTFIKKKNIVFPLFNHDMPLSAEPKFLHLNSQFLFSHEKKVNDTNKVPFALKVLRAKRDKNCKLAL